MPAWRLSITKETNSCLEALEEAIQKHGRLEIFNTEQGSQFRGPQRQVFVVGVEFTSEAFTARLKEEGIKISMDGKGRWRDNVFVERIWKSITYEEVYLRANPSVADARASLDRYIDFYNTRRPHSSLKAQTPYHVYFNRLPVPKAA